MSSDKTNKLFRLQNKIEVRQAVQNKCIRMMILVCTYGVSMTRIFTLMKTKHTMITNQ